MRYFHDPRADALADELLTLSAKANVRWSKGGLLVVTFATIRQYLFVTLTLPVRGASSILCWRPMLPSQADCVKRWAQRTDLVRVVNLNRSEVGDLVESLRNTLPVLTAALHADPLLDGKGSLLLVQQKFLELERAALINN